MKTSNYKKWLYGGVAVLVISLVGGFVAVYWGAFSSFSARKMNYLEPFDTGKMSTLQVVPYCEVKQNPTKYDGKMVKMNARLFWFDHGYFLQDEACLEAIDAKYLDSYRTAILFEETRGDELHLQTRAFHSPDKLFTPVRIIAVGRFTFRSPEGYSDSIEDRTPFHFELFSILQATTEPSDN